MRNLSSNTFIVQYTFKLSSPSSPCVFNDIIGGFYFLFDVQLHFRALPKKLFQTNVIFVAKFELSLCQIDFMRKEYSKCNDHPLKALCCIYVTSFGKVATKGTVSEVAKSLILLFYGEM